MKLTTVRDVWSWNLDYELAQLECLLHGFKFVTFDTEFPGCLRQTGRYASVEKKFSDIRYNVNRTKIIQLGITLSDDDGNVGGVWEFNFRDFDVTRDDHNEASIAMLKRAGINFERLRRDGISVEEFGGRLMEAIRPHLDLHWVTFHGIYDVGYVIKLLTKSEMPESAEDFVAIGGKVLRSVVDVKYMARFCNDDFNGGEISLQKLANLLDVDRVGTTHSAGSDSLLTQSVFVAMKNTFDISPDHFQGFLYGLSYRILPDDVDDDDLNDYYPAYVSAELQDFSEAEDDYDDYYASYEELELLFSGRIIMEMKPIINLDLSICT